MIREKSSGNTKHLALTKREVVNKISEECQSRQNDVAIIVQKTLDCIVDALRDGRHVEFREFGVFEVAERKPRVGRNPRKPEQVVEIPARRVIKFKPGKRMRDMLA